MTDEELLRDAFCKYAVLNIRKVDKKSLLNPTIKSLSLCSMDVFKMVLESGKFDINQQDKMGRTLLMTTTMMHNLEKTMEIVKYNPNVDLIDYYGQNVFFYINTWSYQHQNVFDQLSTLDKMLELSKSTDLLTYKDKQGNNLAADFEKSISPDILYICNKKFISGAWILFNNHVTKRITFFVLMLEKLKF